jgi:alkylhydroperoxidase family enzyme
MTASDADENEEAMSAPDRIPPGGLRELGLVNWIISRLAARVIRVPRVHVFTTLGQQRRLFRVWLLFAGTLLSFGRMQPRDTELVILRVGHLRECEYELQQHRRIAARRGVDVALQTVIFEGHTADNLTDRDRALLAAVDELVATRTLSQDTWESLSSYLDRPQLIEFVTLIGQYDALAATLNTLKVPLDYPG